MVEQPIVQLLVLLLAAALVVEGHQLRLIAEFGIVFLPFRIGLSYSLSQIRALRSQILVLGTGQVVLTTALVALGAWAVGMPPAAAFVVGARRRAAPR